MIPMHHQFGPKGKTPRHVILSTMIEGYAYFRVLTDPFGKPIDLIFLETNDALGHMVSCSQQDIVGRRWSEIVGPTEPDDFDWVYFLGQVAVTGEPGHFTGSFKKRKKNMTIGAFSEEPGYLSVLFRDEAMREKCDKMGETPGRDGESILEAVPETLLIINKEGVITDIKGLGKKSLLPEPDVSIGKKVHDVFDRENAVKLMLSVSRALGTKQAQREEICLSDEKGKRWYETITTPVNASSVVSSVREITERKKTEQALLDNESRWQYALEGNGDGVWDWNLENNTLFLSTGFRQMLRLPEKADHYTFEPEEILALVDPRDFQKVFDTLQGVREEKLDKIDLEYRVVFPDREVKWFQARGKRLFQQANTPTQRMVGTLTEITRRKQAEEEIKHLSFHDKLTGLYNRAFFDEAISRLDTQRQLPLSIIIGDVNGLKLTNDIFGHQEGDKLLVEISRILMESCRKEDVVARWGGDEFAIILPRTTVDKAEEICERIQEGCQRGQVDFIQMSIALGVATKYQKQVDIHEIIKDAENKMYRHKLEKNRNGKGYMLSYLEDILYRKTDETREHSERIRNMGTKMAECMEDHPSFNEILLLGTFHDVGTIAIENSVLNKKGKLSEDEWEVIKKHPDIGYRIADSIHEIAHIADYILSHHEHWDGSGYPRGLKGEEIPYISRLLAILDAYDMMVHPKGYKPAKTHEEAIAELQRCAGKQFDPELVGHFISFMKKGEVV